MTDPFDSLRGRSRAEAGSASAVDSVIAAGRRRRVRALVGGGAGTTLLVGLLVVALTGGSGSPQTLEFSDDPTPTTSASVSEEATVAPSGSPSATASASADPSVAGSFTPPGSTPSPTDEDSWTRTFSDGEPGWSGGFGGCTVGDDAVEPKPGRTISVVTALPRTAWRPGEKLQAYVVITNNGNQRREVDASEFDTRGVLRNQAGEAVSAVHFTDAIRPQPIVLGVGESTRIVAEANTVTCGDGPEDPEPRLAPGTYSLVFRMGDALGRTPPVQVTLDPDASTRSAWPMQPRPLPYPPLERNDCEDSPTGQATLSGFTLSVDAPTRTVRRSGTLNATLVVTATAPRAWLQSDPRSSPVYVDGASAATSTGFDAGPFPEEAGAYAPSATRDDVPELKAGDSLRYPVSWRPHTCPQAASGGVSTDLAPGVYEVTFGLLVFDGSPAERGFWFMDDTLQVTVTN
jgi:hypothetical protein